MFGFGKAFKGRSYYVFDYKPRYYDERKERIEKIKEKYTNPENTEKNIPLEENVKAITFSKNELRKSWAKNKSGGSDRSVTIRLAIIITLIVGAITYIFDLHSLF